MMWYKSVCELFPKFYLPIHDIINHFQTFEKCEKTLENVWREVKKI